MPGSQHYQQFFTRESPAKRCQNNNKTRLHHSTWCCLKQSRCPTLVLLIGHIHHQVTTDGYFSTNIYLNAATGKTPLSLTSANLIPGPCTNCQYSIAISWDNVCPIIKTASQSKRLVVAEQTIALNGSIDLQIYRSEVTLNDKQNGWASVIVHQDGGSIHSRHTPSETMCSVPHTEKTASIATISWLHHHDGWTSVTVIRDSKSRPSAILVSCTDVGQLRWRTLKPNRSKSSLGYDHRQVPWVINNNKKLSPGNTLQR